MGGRMKSIKSVLAVFMVVMALTFFTACVEKNILGPPKTQNDDCVKRCEQKFKDKGSKRALENCIRNCEQK
jgi:hypothetical protein